MGSVVIIVLGSTGSGKSTLVSAYSKWLLSKGSGGCEGVALVIEVSEVRTEYLRFTPK